MNTRLTNAIDTLHLVLLSLVIYVYRLNVFFVMILVFR